MICLCGAGTSCLKSCQWLFVIVVFGGCCGDKNHSCGYSVLLVPLWNLPYCMRDILSYNLTETHIHNIIIIISSFNSSVWPVSEL